MTTSASGAAGSGFLPASLAALLNSPPSPLAPQMPQFFGTTVVGSMFSAPPPLPRTAAATHVNAPPVATPAHVDASTAGLSAPAIPLLDSGAMTAASSTLAILPTASGGLAAPALPLLQPPPPTASPMALAHAVAAPAYVAAASPAAPASVAVAPFHFANQITIRLTPDN
nr:predicted GPI-anchored protein 58 [Lolium perenne]